MWVALAAVVSVLGLVLVELLRRRADHARDVSRAAAERGAVYEDFIDQALHAVQALQLLAQLAPRPGFLPLLGDARAAYRDAQRVQRHLAVTHARLRRVAPDAVAKASDVVLSVITQAADLTSRRRRATSEWDIVWRAGRDARMSFEGLARADTLVSRAA